MVQLENKILVDVMHHRQPVNLYLQNWLDFWKRKPNIKVNIFSTSYDICLARRQSLYNFVNKEISNGWNYLIQLDVDVCPVPSSDNLFTYYEPLIYLGMASKDLKFNHYGNDGFGCAAFRIHKSIAEKIDIANSFDFKFNSNRTEIEKCECWTFHEQCKKLGFSARMVGVIGHITEQIIIPTESGVVGWKYIN